MNEQRFWLYVDTSAGPDKCWPWRGAKHKSGRGAFKADGKLKFAHRIAYELLVGPIPNGKEIDHVRSRGCTVHDCCNPVHLEPVTHHENLMRGDSPTGWNARKTHCVNGHEFTPENTYRPDSGGRYCIACRRQHRLAYRERSRNG